MDKFLKISGCKISYTDTGNGPVIVFLHGWMASKKIYEKVVGLLSKKYRCISIDIPGFGNSGVVSEVSEKNNQIGFNISICQFQTVFKAYLFLNNICHSVCT